MHAFMMDYHSVVAAHPELGMWDTIKEAANQVTHQSVVKFDKVIPIFLFIFMAPIIGMIISIIITLIIVHLYKNQIRIRQISPSKDYSWLLQHSSVWDTV